MRRWVINLVPILSLGIACKSKEVSWDTQEDSRRQAKENAEFVAKKFRKQYMPDARMVVRGDSTIGKRCAQGDGWATVDLHYKGRVIVLKCSTVSESIGCMTKTDFNKRDFADEDGQCNNNIPFPLPKIKK